jgi:hypothetical protein
MPSYTIGGQKFSSETPLSTADLEELAKTVQGSQQAPVEEPSTLDKFGAAVKEQLPALGGMAVPAATALMFPAVGIPALIGSAALGSGLGETARQYFSNEDPNTTRIAQEAAMGGAGEGFGQAIIPAFKGAANVVKSVLGVPQQSARQATTLAEREAAQALLEKQGATLSTGQVGGAPSQIFEGLTRAGLGEGAFASNQKAIGTALQNEKNAIINSVGDANIDAVEAGNLLFKSIDDAGDLFSAKVAPFYERVLDKKGSAVIVDTQPVADAALNIVNQAKSLSASGKTAVAIDPEDLSQLTRLADTANTMSFKQAHEFRSALLRQARILETKYGKGTPLSQTVNAAVDVVNKQMDDAAQTFNPQVQKEYRAVSAEYKRAMNTLYDDTLVKLLQKNPEKIGDSIGSSGNMTEALKVKKALRFAKEQGVKGTDKIFDNFLSGYLQNVFKGTGDEVSSFANLGDKLAQDPKFSRTFYTVLADKPIVKDNIKNLVNAAKVAEKENKPTILSGMFGTGAQGALVTSLGAMAVGTPGTVIAEIAAGQALLAKILTNKRATSLLLKAEKIAQNAGQAKAIEFLQKSQIVQRFAGQEAVRNPRISKDLFGIQPQPIQPSGMLSGQGQ